MSQILALTAGSIAGGLARHFLAGALYRQWGAGFPHGTLAVNLIGCFLIGIFSVMAEEKLYLGPSGRLLLMTGFCGAFTTFSTFMLETGNLVKDGELFRALLNVVLSVIAGFLVFRLGILLGKIF
jgi:CrcB protein